MGSQLLLPDIITGFREYAFDVDTYDGANRLNTHLQSLPRRPEAPGQLTVVVVGGGLTGIETAAEVPGKLRTALAQASQSSEFRVILADHQPIVGSDMGQFARPIVAGAHRAGGRNAGGNRLETVTRFSRRPNPRFRSRPGYKHREPAQVSQNAHRCPLPLGPLPATRIEFALHLSRAHFANAGSPFSSAMSR